MHVAAVIDEHIAPAPAQHFHRIHIGRMGVQHPDEILRHSGAAVKAAVFTGIIWHHLITLGQRNGSEIVQIGIAVLRPLFEGMADFGITHRAYSVGIGQHSDRLLG